LFFLVNAPLLCLAVFEWRAASIAVILMLPNILGSIGGAEKDGWSTHYPSFFFPSLVWAAMLGYAVLYQKAASRKRLRVALAGASALVLYLCILNPDSSQPVSFSLSNASNNFLVQMQEQTQQFVLQRRARANLASEVYAITHAVPPHTIVSSVETGMPLLYPNRTIEFFPADIDHADYAVLGAEIVGGQIIYNGALDYLGASEQTKLNDLVLDRMKHDGYDTAHPMLFPGYNGLAIVKRIH
jgi:hypothetical protein